MCEICTFDFTSKLRTKVECTYCNENCCVQCLKQFILMKPLQPHCMHCKRSFSTEFLDSLFSKNFRLNDLRKHKISILMEQEKSLFPETLLEVEKEDAQILHNQTLYQHQVEIYKVGNLKDVKPVTYDLVDSINRIRCKLVDQLSILEKLGVALKSKERKAFIQKCTCCKDGYLSSQWKCNQCKVTICNKCHCLKNEEHVCKQEDIDSIILIEKETKPCPHCGIRVQKTEGCNQMWCTSCNGAFDFKTGLKVTGPIHNPHFHDYQRSNPEEAAHLAVNWRDQCEENADPTHWPFNYGGHLVQHILLKIDQKYYQTFRNSETKITSICRLMIERSQHARTYLPYTPASYRELRKKRIRGEINDVEWSSLLSRKETKREKEHFTKLLDELLLAVARDTIYAFLNLEGNKNSLNDFINLVLNPLDKARDYYNENSVNGKINEYWLLR